MEIACRVIVLLLLPINFVATQNASRVAQEFHVGVILDWESMVGQIARTSISLAMEDFYAVHQNHSTKLVLHIRDSMRDDVQAAGQAINLLENYNVEAIIGPQKSSQAIFISKLGNRSHVPVISFTATSPSLSSKILPYFVRATLNDSAQVNCIASIVKTYGWRKVVTVYEDTDYGRGIIPYLVDVLQDVDVLIPYQSVIPLSATSEEITLELYKLMTMQTTVFVVHMSLTLASSFFIKAQEVGMMNKGYAWVVTDGVTNLIDSLSPSVLESLNGALGVEFYVPKSRKLDDFTMRWNERYQIDNPTDPPLKLSIFGLWSYDTIWAVAQAAEKLGLANATFQKPGVTRNSNLETLETSSNGPKLLQAIAHNKFKGLSGNFDLSDKQLQISIFRIINVVRKGRREIGFWTVQNGISQQLDNTRAATTYSGSVHNLNPVVWPGQSKEIPRGFGLPINGKKLQVGVCVSGYPEFMMVEKDHITGATIASGLSIDVFEEAVKRLPYALPYEYVIFNTTNDGSSQDYNDFVYQVYLKIYDIVIGDITIRYNRTLYVDFTLPHTESGIAMVVPVRDSINKNTWIFLKPLAPGMWLGSIAFFIYTGVVVLILEFLGNNENVRGPIPRQLGIMIFFSIFEEKELVQRFLSRIVLVVWLVFLMVLTSSYTASLTSMLTVQQLQPTVTDVHGLLKSGECVGYYRGSYIEGLLEELGFDRSKIKPYDSNDDIHDALSRGSNNGGIAALVHEVPYIKLFLANHCKGYTMVGPIYKAAGFGYALAKGNPLLGDISKAILNVTGGDDMIQIEKKWIGDQNDCQNVGPLTGSSRLTLANFRGLFILTGVASTSSLLIALIIYFYKKKHLSAMITVTNNNRPEETEINDENSEPQEGSQGGKAGQNAQRADREENGQLEEQTSLELVSDTSSETCTIMPNNGSIVIFRGERTTGLQVELI